jgi:alkylation response protein AidB-like acyl-CoA dehydrogenase
VPKDNLVGEVNQGWAMAKALLGFERIFFGSPKQSAFALERLRGVAQHLGVWEDPLFREKYTRLHMDLADHGDLFQSFADQLRRDEALGPDVSMLKLNQTELYQRITDLMLEIAGENGGLMNAMEDNRALNPSGFFIQARPTTIYGGTSEIQRGIIAREVLKLPA